jgi:dihydrofolate reductase
MTIISLVYARSRNGVIGAGGGLPWHIPSDLKRFKETTLGKPVIMGRKTWDSLRRKPLPGRLNIVLTQADGFVAEGAEVARSLDEAITRAGHAPEICVIGGGEIYSMFLTRADRIYETVVDLDVSGDTFGPQLQAEEWCLVESKPGLRGPSDSATFTTRILDRIR